MRILPSRTADNAIDGVVITFVDIGRLKTAERRDIEGTRFIATVGDAMEKPYLVLDSGLRIISANRAFQQMFRLDAERLEGELLPEIGAGEWNIPALKRMLKAVATDKEGFENSRSNGASRKSDAADCSCVGSPSKGTVNEE